jgi:hypothetical protein
MQAVPRLCRFYHGICLTTEEKARKNLLAQKKRHDIVYSEMVVTTYNIAACENPGDKPYLSLAISKPSAAMWKC